MKNKKNTNLVENSKSTVVAEFIPFIKKEEYYQSEDMLEKDFIKQLELQGYEYLKIHKENELIENLKKQLEKLNDYFFSDKEWDEFF